MRIRIQLTHSDRFLFLTFKEKIEEVEKGK